jgi:transposase InsO family protein
MVSFRSASTPLQIGVRSSHRLPVATGLLARRFNSDAPSQQWCGNITYIATDEGWLYLVAVINPFGRQMVGRGCSHRCRPAR